MHDIFIIMKLKLCKDLQFINIKISLQIKQTLGRFFYNFSIDFI